MKASKPTVRVHDLLNGKRSRVSTSRWLQIRHVASPLIFSIPHAGTWVPEQAWPHVMRERFLLLDTDLFTDELYGGIPLPASCVTTRISPYVANCNRGPLTSKRTIVPTNFLYGRPTLHRPMSQRQQAGFIADFYTPYHQALLKLIRTARSRFGFALVIDGHSYNLVGGPTTVDPGEVRADIDVGTNKGLSAGPSVVRALVGQLKRTPSLKIAIDKPYRGGQITRQYGDPKRGIHVIQLELNRSLYMQAGQSEHDLNKKTIFQKKPSGMLRLQNALSKALQAALRAAAQS
jgi:N-formylglutamate deformylase